MIVTKLVNEIGDCIGLVPKTFEGKKVARKKKLSKIKNRFTVNILIICISHFKLI